MTTIISRRQTAYCPEYEETRTIYAEILKHEALAADFFDVRRFDCDEKDDCALAQGVPFCPFLIEVLSSLKRR